MDRAALPPARRRDRQPGGLRRRCLGQNHTDQLTVKAIVQIARGMGKKTIAEFVESEPSLELLRQYGVDFAQGYQIGKPAPIAAGWPARSAV